MTTTQIFFFDSSALVKRYSDEAGSAWVDATVTREIIYISPITGAEVIATLARAGKASEAARSRANNGIAEFYKDFDAGTLEVIEPNQKLFAGAMTIAQSGDLRGCDAVQLASAQFLLQRISGLGQTAELIFVSSDNALNRAAHKLGMPVENPLDH